MQLAKHLRSKLDVLIITKSTVQASNSYRAQGGIAAAVAKGDEPFLHYVDTIKAGCSFHNDQEVWELVKKAPAIIRDLKNQGVSFDTNNSGELSLGMEGAHSQNRILHCGGDATGRHLMDHLITTLRPEIDIIENQFVYELIIDPVTNRCIGIKAKDESGSNHTYYADNIVLAVGGIGGLFSFTSNESSIAGDGVALAYRAGAEIVDMEFIQFHPTLLYVNGKTAGLISEAVRGEGARLVDESGMALMQGKHPLGDLAPRHIVAKEIFQHRFVGNEVFLDISMIHKFEVKFPTITALCEKNGISLQDKKIPVAPGCHFLMGGVAVNSVGQTSIDGLFAIGETAATGVHGANRLASNSLLEGLYYGEKVATYINENGVRKKNSIHINKESEEPTRFVLPEIEEIKALMMAHAGIIRTHLELRQLFTWLNQYNLTNGIDQSLDKWSVQEIQVMFMLQVAKLVTTSALLRTESRGGHCREDFPVEIERWRNVHIVQSQKGIEMRRWQDEHYQVEVHA